MPAGRQAGSRKSLTSAVPSAVADAAPRVQASSSTGDRLRRRSTICVAASAAWHNAAAAELHTPYTCSHFTCAVWLLLR